MFLSSNSSQIEIINPTLDENKINELDDLFRSFICQLKDEVGLLRYEHNMTSIYDALQQVLKNENNLIFFSNTNIKLVKFCILSIKLYFCR